MTVFVYVLQSQHDGTFYTGITKSVSQRVHEHNAGKTKSIKHKRPLQLILQEEYSSYSEARSRERFLKSGDGREFIRQKLKEDNSGFTS